ncbi:MAG: glycosyl hydrolase [Pseudomonadales bacterium]|nr:glycosyl hydrolase [Pseudomonadales bacterium]
MKQSTYLLTVGLLLSIAPSAGYPADAQNNDSLPFAEMNSLQIPRVDVEGFGPLRVVLQRENDTSPLFQLIEAEQASPGLIPGATFDITTGLLEIPLAKVDSEFYQAEMQLLPGDQFQLASADAVNTAAGEPLVPFTFEQLRSGSIERILHCSGPLFNPEEHDGYVDTFVETAPFMVRLDLSLTPSNRFTPEEKLEILRTHLETYSIELPHLSLTFTSTLADGTVDGLDDDLAAGELDDLVIGIAEIVRDAKVPFFIRIGPEFNGFWNGYAPDTFAAAFRRVVDLFRENGADNAIFNWNYKAWQGDPTPYMEFYPGDDYVDWWSIDLFTSDFDVASVKIQADAFLADAAARGKPVIIPESAPATQDLEDPAVWEQWFVPYFELVRGDANIKAFCYSNRNFAKNDVTLTDWGNLRIDESAALAPLYQEELRRPVYQHRIDF